MALVLRSLRDFKRFLGKPGATIEIVKNTFVDRQPVAFQAAYREKGMYEPRTVQALSKKAAIFAVRGHPTTVWLYWDKGTRKWRFSEDTVAIPLDTGLGPPDEIIYRCRYSPGTEATYQALPPEDGTDGPAAKTSKSLRPKLQKSSSPANHGLGQVLAGSPFADPKLPAPKLPNSKPSAHKTGKMSSPKRAAEPRQGRLL